MRTIVNLLIVFILFGCTSHPEKPATVGKDETKDTPSVEVAKSNMPIANKINVDGITKSPSPTKPIDQWGYQDLQDHLKSKGWTTSRGLGAGGMYFDSGDGRPLTQIQIRQLSEFAPENIPLTRIISQEDAQLLANARKVFETTIDSMTREDQKLGAEAYKRFREMSELNEKLKLAARKEIEEAPFDDRREIVVRTLAEQRAREKAKQEFYDSDRAAQDKRRKAISIARDSLEGNVYKLEGEILQRSPFSPYQPFLANDYGSLETAKKEAARIMDVEQREVIVSGRFIIHGSPEARATLKNLLP